MKPGRPEIIVVTRDLALAHAATLAAPEAWTEWCDTFSGALTAIGPDTKVLICDSTLDNPLGRLLPILFVDQLPGRRAVVVQPWGQPPAVSTDDRVTFLSWPLSFDSLSDAISGWEALEEAIAA
jgi:hypothetical protein